MKVKTQRGAEQEAAIKRSNVFKVTR